MVKPISEQALEDAIVADLKAAGYFQRQPSAYDKSLCLDAGPLIDFVQATQPKEWEKFVKQHRDSARQNFLKRVSQAIESDGVIAALRLPVKANGCKFRLAYFQPETSRNPETERLYLANQFTVIQQVRYSEKTNQSLDLVLFLNGLPLFTAELKNPFNGQDVKDAITQYKRTRDPREPLFVHGRCAAHFAVDPFLVYMTTQLKGTDTFFLPFNMGVGEGKNKGAGNPPPKLGDGFSTSYLWRDIWSRDRVLELMQYFVQDIREHDENSGKLVRKVIFPRYHQLDTVKALVADAKENAAGENYLIQHSAGSGKSNSIAWLAHRLASLQRQSSESSEYERVFDTVLVVTDRRALDRQLSKTVSSFEQTAGLVVHVENGKELMAAMESGKQVIITTLQKFPVILERVRQLEDEWRTHQDKLGSDPKATPPKFYKPDGQKFALILDEAHSSQGGEASKDLKRTTIDQDDLKSAAEIAAHDQKARGRLEHLSTFAFTATPKEKTLELFGEENPNPKKDEPKFSPFRLYSMRQAIDEGFILDVLQNYATYHTSWTLSKKIKENPSYDPAKATKFLKRFVVENPKTIREKVEIICEHCNGTVIEQINQRGKAMLVTSSNMAAKNFKLEVDDYIKTQGFKWKALVAFSGTVTDDKTKEKFTEASMNGFPDSKTQANFELDQYRLLIVNRKFQTGFDQPLLHTMYVDKSLSDVTAVQTLSRLNRTRHGKTDTCILDFGDNEARIQEAFSRYYGETNLKNSTNPNDIYTLESRLKKQGFFFDADLEQFNKVYYVAQPKQDRVYAVLQPVLARVEEADEEEQKKFRSSLNKYIKLYSFLGQIIGFEDPEIEQLFQFCRHLVRLVPIPPEEQPHELKQYVEVGPVKLRSRKTNVFPEKAKGTMEVKELGSGDYETPPPELEPLSEILDRLNERHGTTFGGESDEEFLQILEAKLDEDEGLSASFEVNTPENARLTFTHKANDHIQDMIDTNFKFFKQINDKPDFAEFLNDLLFDRYSERKKNEEGEREH